MSTDFIYKAMLSSHKKENDARGREDDGKYVGRLQLTWQDTWHMTHDRTILMLDLSCSLEE